MFIITVASFCFSYYFVNVALIPDAIKRAVKYPIGSRLKPIDCVQCLSVWVAVILYFLPLEWSVFTSVVFGAGFIANKIK